MRIKKHLAAILAAVLSISMMATSASAAITIASPQKTEIEFTSGSQGSAESTGIFGYNGKVDDKSTLPTWELSDGVLVIRGSGEVYFPNTASPFLDNDYIHTVIVEEGITSLPSRLFQGNDNLENIIVLGTRTPTNVAYECPNLKNIIVGAGLSKQTAMLYTDLRISLYGNGSAYETNPVIIFGGTPSANATIMDYDTALNQASDMIAAMDLPESVWDILPGELNKSNNLDNDTNTQPIVNANTSTWAQDAVNQAAQQGFIPTGTLGADYTKNITRAQFAAIAVQVYEEITGDVVSYASADFKDSKGDIAVAKAYTLGILTGYNSSKNQAEVNIGPNDLITREQAAVMLVRLGERLGLSLTSNVINMPFTDEISNWASASVQAVYKHGIMNGTSATTFSAKANYTIEQSIVTMVRLADYVS